MPLRIKDIAAKLGVSPSTVSMVINNKPGISEKTRKRVLDFLNESGHKSYIMQRTPNMNFGNINFIVFKKHGKVVGDTPFFSSLIEEIERAAKDNGYNLSILYITGDTSYKIEELNNRLLKDAKGILILATEMVPSDMDYFLSLNVPIVAIDSALAGVNVDKVCINNFESSYKATRYLYNMGHRNIGYLHSSVWIKNFEERSSGYHSALKDLGLRYDPKFTFLLDANTEGAYRDMLKYLEKNPDLPTAFFADNDIIALGALKALKEKNIAVPNDVSIIGMDDIPFCTLMEPSLSTMRVERKYLGKVAVERLISLIENNNNYRIKQEIDTTIIERNSVRNLNIE